MRRMQRSFNKFTRLKRHGQGVVEYAGAMVVATVLIGLSVFVVPDQYAGMIANIIESTLGYMINMIPA